MGFDFETNTFSGDNFELLPQQVIKEVHDLRPGNIYYFDIDEMWSDHERKLWVNANAHVWTYEELEEEIVDFDVNLGRIICVNEGLIVDGSHYEKYDYEGLENRFGRTSIKSIQQEDPDAVDLPVIYLASNKDELELIKESLAENYNLVVDGTEIDHLVSEYVMYSAEDDEEFEDEQ